MSRWVLIGPLPILLSSSCICCTIYKSLLYIINRLEKSTLYTFPIFQLVLISLLPSLSIRTCTRITRLLFINCLRRNFKVLWINPHNVVCTCRRFFVKHRRKLIFLQLVFVGILFIVFLILLYLVYDFVRIRFLVLVWMRLVYFSFLKPFFLLGLVFLEVRQTFVYIIVLSYLWLDLIF